MNRDLDLPGDFDDLADIPVYSSKEARAQKKDGSTDMKDVQTAMSTTNTDSDPDALTTEFPAGENLMEPIVFDDSQDDTSGTKKNKKVDTPGRRGTLDFGLLIARMGVGGLLMIHGIENLLGIFSDGGRDALSAYAANEGFTHTDLLAILTGVGQLVAGVMLILGVLTPVAITVLLSIMVLALLAKLPIGGDTVLITSPDKPSVESHLLFVIVLAALSFTGPGRLSIDRKWGFSLGPRFSGAVVFVIALVIAGLAWFYLNGSNPLVLNS